MATHMFPSAWESLEVVNTQILEVELGDHQWIVSMSTCSLVVDLQLIIATCTRSREWSLDGVDPLVQLRMWIITGRVQRNAEFVPTKEKTSTAVNATCVIRLLVTTTYSDCASPFFVRSFNTN